MATTNEQKVRIIVTVPNQKVVQVKHEICYSEHIYTMCNVEANSIAMKELSANTYKLYMYFDLNQDGYLFALSYKAVHEATGMSDKTYQKAIKELIEKGYLVQSKEQKNLYIFYDGKENTNRKVKNTQRESKDYLTSSKEMDETNGKKFGDSTPKTTGEILQDNINNTIYNNTDASLDGAEAPKELIKILREHKLTKKQLGNYRTVSIDDEIKNEHMYNSTHYIDDNGTLKDILDCASCNGVNKDYACSYLAELLEIA